MNRKDVREDGVGNVYFGVSFNKVEERVSFKEKLSDDEVGFCRYFFF